jgi:hypothetical protein
LENNILTESNKKDGSHLPVAEKQTQEILNKS